MGKQSFLDKVREWIGGIAFGVFLWANRMTADEYFSEIVRKNEFVDAEMRKYDLISEEIKWCEAHRNPEQMVYQDGFIAGLYHALWLMKSRPSVDYSTVPDKTVLAEFVDGKVTRTRVCTCLSENESPSGKFELCDECRLEEEIEDEKLRPTPRALDGAGFAPHCTHGYNGLCPVCDALQTPPRQ